MQTCLSPHLDTELHNRHQDGKDQATEEDHEHSANVDDVQRGGLRPVPVRLGTGHCAMFPPFVVDHLKMMT